MYKQAIIKCHEGGDSHEGRESFGSEPEKKGGCANGCIMYLIYNENEVGILQEEIVFLNVTPLLKQFSS